MPVEWHFYLWFVLKRSIFHSAACRVLKCLYLFALHLNVWEQYKQSYRGVLVCVATCSLSNDGVANNLSHIGHCNKDVIFYKSAVDECWVMLTYMMLWRMNTWNVWSQWSYIEFNLFTMRTLQRCPNVCPFVHTEYGCGLRPMATNIALAKRNKSDVKPKINWNIIWNSIESKIRAWHLA